MAEKLNPDQQAIVRDFADAWCKYMDSYTPGSKIGPGNAGSAYSRAHDRALAANLIEQQI